MVDAVGRLFLCARCREQVVPCSNCDRGQRYCGRTCSEAVRRERQREAGRRYQRSSNGRANHAERSRRWRLRQREQRQSPGATDAFSAAPVTHHGSSDARGADPGPLPSTEPEPAPATATGAALLQLCPSCAGWLQPLVRQNFLRPRRAVASKRLARAGPCPAPDDKATERGSPPSRPSPYRVLTSGALPCSVAAKTASSPPNKRGS